MEIVDTFGCEGCGAEVIKVKFTEEKIRICNPGLVSIPVSIGIMGVMKDYGYVEHRCQEDGNKEGCEGTH